MNYFGFSKELVEDPKLVVKFFGKSKLKLSRLNCTHWHEMKISLNFRIFEFIINYPFHHVLQFSSSKILEKMFDFVWGESTCIFIHQLRCLQCKHELYFRNRRDLTNLNRMRLKRIGDSIKMVSFARWNSSNWIRTKS